MICADRSSRFQVGVSLLIIDPIVSAVSGDMHRANDVRRSLQPVADLAAELGCAVIGITHFAKNTSGNDTTERVI
jgi:putative DNA primase/helicase